MQRNSGDFGKLWTHEGNKFVIGTLQGDTLEIVAQYNPKELSRTASATWANHPNTSARQSASGENNLWSEYKTTEPRTLTFELVFDGYEEGISIAPLVEQLESLTLPKDMSSKTFHDRHPQACVAVWGSQSLRCVVVSVASKLSMFDASGEPLRATCTVVLKETDVVAMMAADKTKSGFKSRLDQIAAMSNVKKHDTRPVVDASKPKASAPAAKPTPVMKPAPAAAPAKPVPAPTLVETKTPTPTPTNDLESSPAAGAPTQTGNATPADEQGDRDAAAASEPVGTPSHRFAGDDDLDSPRDASQPDAISSADAAPKPAGDGIGHKDTPFAGDDDIDSPRAPKPVTKTTHADGTVSGTPSTQFSGNDEIDSPRGAPQTTTPPKDKPPIVVPKNYKPPTDLE